MGIAPVCLMLLLLCQAWRCQLEGSWHANAAQLSGMHRRTSCITGRALQQQVRPGITKSLQSRLAGSNDTAGAAGHDLPESTKTADA